jgi:hypothetical protein
MLCRLLGCRVPSASCYFAAAAAAAVAVAQAYILFRAKLASPFTFSSGPESLEVELFDPSSIPFDQIAFSSVSITLQHYLQARGDALSDVC